MHDLTGRRERLLVVCHRHGLLALTPLKLLLEVVLLQLLLSLTFNVRDECLSLRVCARYELSAEVLGLPLLHSTPLLKHHAAD